ncbi:hypothetical protein ACH5RR_018567 [Cinchona calisaya]|uniref:Uncharacterized protein n=1 Tax=Cinchona calisaya TaxID=153742 RepID=A0ABD2ZN25_9GENT
MKTTTFSLKREMRLYKIFSPAATSALYFGSKTPRRSLPLRFSTLPRNLLHQLSSIKAVDSAPSSVSFLQFFVRKIRCKISTPHCLISTKPVNYPIFIQLIFVKKTKVWVLAFNILGKSLI